MPLNPSRRGRESPRAERSIRLYASWKIMSDSAMTNIPVVSTGMKYLTIVRGERGQRGEVSPCDRYRLSIEQGELVCKRH